MNQKNQYMSEVKKICHTFSTQIQNSTLFSNDYKQAINTKIEKEVIPLLSSQKPKVMVYGIYNAGKSTLINAIFKDEVAEVADKPTTATIAEYDMGKYILVDSPGINAPIHHEELSDRHLTNCHVILFVISSKGLFEDRVNYQKLWSLMEKGIPFFIVLNERAPELPPVEQEEARRKAQAKHDAEIKAIKHKIIKNLITISGRRDIGNKYEVIVVNAKRAWLGHLKNKSNLYNKSNVSELTGRINQILEGDGSLKQILTPLANLETLIAKVEKELHMQSGNKDFGIKIETLRHKIWNMKEEFRNSIQDCASKQYTALYNHFLGHSQINVDFLWKEVAQDVQESYQRLLFPVTKYINENFPELGIYVDENCNIQMNENFKLYTMSTEVAENVLNEPMNIKESSSDTDMVGMMGTIGSEVAKNFASNINTSKVVKSVLPVQTGMSTFNPITLIPIIGQIFDIFISKRRQEEEEWNHLQMEVEAYNRGVQQRIEEDIRRRQDANSLAHKQINEIVSKIRLEIDKQLNETFDNILQTVNLTVEENNLRTNEIKKMLTVIKQLYQEVDILRKKIM